MKSDTMTSDAAQRAHRHRRDEHFPRSGWRIALVLTCIAAIAAGATTPLHGGLDFGWTPLEGRTLGGVDLGRGLPRDGLDADRSDVDRRSAGPVPGTLCYRTTNARIAHGVRNHSRDDIDCALRATGRRHRRGCARDLKRPIILTVRSGTRGAIRTSLHRRTAAQAPAPRVAKHPARCSPHRCGRGLDTKRNVHTHRVPRTQGINRAAQDEAAKQCQCFPAHAGMNQTEYLDPRERQHSPPARR